MQGSGANIHRPGLLGNLPAAEDEDNQAKYAAGPVPP
jgi:hypothetical protein